MAKFNLKPRRPQGTNPTFNPVAHKAAMEALARADAKRRAEQQPYESDAMRDGPERY